MERKSGAKIGKWLLIDKVENSKKHIKWNCICECGAKKQVYDCHLKSGKSKGCKKCATNYHGMVDTPEWQSWHAMRTRCLNKNHKRYGRYGGRGITICQRWMDSFLNFLSDMGSRPPGTTLDRIDNNGNYEPNNCRWANEEQQQNNTKKNRYFMYEGSVYSMAQLARKVNLPYWTMIYKIKNNIKNCNDIYVEIKKV